MKHLTNGMLSNRTLKSLSLAWNSLCDEGCYHVADMVADSVSLEVHTGVPCLRSLRMAAACLTV